MPERTMPAHFLAASPKDVECRAASRSTVSLRKRDAGNATTFGRRTDFAAHRLWCTEGKGGHDL
jgi:hypothetical protein